WIVKLESDGDIEWERSFGWYQKEIAHEIRETSDGGFIAVGYTESVLGSYGDKDFLAMKITASGELDWQLPLGGTGTDRAFAIRQTADEGFVMAGRTKSNNGNVTDHHGDHDFWVVKLGPCGVNPGIEIDHIYTIQSHDIALSTTHQWIDCSDGSIIEGVEGSSFVPEHGGDYAVIVSNGACIDTSECINICPLDNYVAAGSDIIVAGEDSPGVTYQWIDCSTGNPIEGEVDYFFEPATNGEYAVIITEENCSVTSVCRVLCPEVINLDIVVEESTIQSLEDTLQATFQWIDCNTGDPIEGETGPAFTPTISGDYAVVVSRGVCSETSECVTICMIDPAVSASETTIEALADPFISTYQWINCADGSSIAGETDQTFTPTISGDYAVIITQASCMDTSACTTICQVSTEVTVSEFTIQSQADTINSSFQWVNCSDGMPIEGEINQVFTPEESGEYAVIVTQGSCMDTSECATFCLVNTEIIVAESSIQAQADSLNSNFQWIDCNTGVALEGATSPTFNPVVTGDYAVIITQGNCESTSDCVNMVIVDVNEPTERNIILYPNPVKDLLVLEVNNELLQASFSIYDLNGGEVFSGKINSLKSTIALNGFADGVYTIKLETATEVISKRFIKSD
ncbi:MAG: T9SS C-terminal target domain-containing protein, partial [Bacteroidetes bacterium]